MSLFDNKTVIYLFIPDFPLRKMPFFALEQIEEGNQKIIHVVDMTRENTFTLGRNLSNDIVVNNISVSRKQAYFKINRDAHRFLIIADDESRFGSFIRMPELLNVTERPIAIQVERKLFYLKLERRFTPA